MLIEPGRIASATPRYGTLAGSGAIRQYPLLLPGASVLALFLLAANCATQGSDVNPEWSGTINTSASGEIVVQNSNAQH